MGSVAQEMRNIYQHYPILSGYWKEHEGTYLIRTVHPRKPSSARNRRTLVNQLDRVASWSFEVQFRTCSGRVSWVTEALAVAKHRGSKKGHMGVMEGWSDGRSIVLQDTSRVLPLIREKEERARIQILRRTQSQSQLCCVCWTLLEHVFPLVA